MADVDEDTLALRGDEYNLDPGNRHCNLEQAVASGAYDVAVVATPNHLHYPVARQVLSAGLHCLVEKPFTENMEHARGLVALAETKDCVLLVGQNYRYKEMMRFLSRIISEEQLGRLSGIEGSFHRFRPPRYSHEIRMAFPMLYLQAIHHLDWILGILPTRISRVISRHRRAPWSGFESPSICHVLLESEDGILISYRGSYESHGEITPYDGLWRIECEKGDLIVDNNQTAWQITEEGTSRKRLYQTTKSETSSESRLLDDFLIQIRDGTEAPVSGRRNLETMRLLFEVIDSGRQD